MTIDKNLSFLFKGPPGFAKTCAAASFALEGPVFLAYFDKSKPVELFHYFKNIIKRPDLLDNIDYEVYGAANCNEYLNKLGSFIGGCKYIAVITDSLTSLTGAAVNWSLGFKDNKKSSTRNMDLIPDFDEYKTETSLVVQAIDISLTLPTNIIWTAHPLPQTKIEGSGRGMSVTKTVSLVTYGNKVAGLVPGRFTEIYHFGKETDYQANPSTIKNLVYTNAIGEDFAKTSLALPHQFDITNRMFYEVWKELVNKEA